MRSEQMFVYRSHAPQVLAAKELRQGAAKELRQGAARELQLARARELRLCDEKELRLGAVGSPPRI